MTEGTLTVVRGGDLGVLNFCKLGADWEVKYPPTSSTPRVKFCRVVDKAGLLFDASNPAVAMLELAMEVALVSGFVNTDCMLLKLLGANEKLGEVSVGESRSASRLHPSANNLTLPELAERRKEGEKGST